MKHNQIRQVVFPILAALIWGTAVVAQDVCADTIGTFTFNAVRYFIAVLALLVLIAVLHAVHKDRPQPTEAEKRAGRKQLWLGGFCCGTALAIASNFQQAGITAGTDAGKAGFLTALYVVLVPVFGLFFRRKVSLPVWIAVVLSVVSLYLLCIKGSFRLAAGDLLVLVCAVCFAVHILVIDHFTAYCDGVKLCCLQFLFLTRSGREKEFCSTMMAKEWKTACGQKCHPDILQCFRLKERGAVYNETKKVSLLW